MGYSVERSLEHLNEFGKNMGAYPYLPDQIRAMKDFSEGKECRFNGTDKEERCPIETGMIRD